jgi:hypothetical protein
MEMEAALEKAEVALDVKGGEVILSLLHGTGLSAWKKRTTTDEADAMADRIRSLRGDVDAVYDAAYKLMNGSGWDLSTNFSDRNRDLSKKQRERQEAALRVVTIEMKKWIKDWVPRFIKEQYVLYSGRREPKINSIYLRDFLTEGGELPRTTGFHEAWKEMDRRKQTAFLDNVLKTLTRQGKLEASLGSGRGGRETRFYNPPGF